ncbi:hypothetical protein VUN82_13345 [Micrococcaceae bacterium Sec5.1]
MLDMVVHDLQALGVRLNSSSALSSEHSSYLQIVRTELPPLSCRGESSGAI